MSRQPSNGYRNLSNGSVPFVTSAAAQSQQRLATPTQHQHHRPISPGSGVSSSTAAAAASAAAMSRAERFEDEKRRVIDSLFTKLDANGQLAESYITHIRIQEDAQYASAPPPPDSPESNKKPRLIIIAVRSTGRVRMHKARENNTGSFSIGKTWNLEEMSAIEHYGGGKSTGAAQSEKEALHRAWAGNVGFTVTITKPYYWQAGTSKEKDFFIASAVKIYRKYTKGLVPELRGFEEREKAMMLGGMPAQQQQQQQSSSPAPSSQQDLSPGMRAESRDMSPVAPPQPPFAQRPQSREESRYRQSPGPPPSIHDAQPGSAVASRQHSESPAPSRFGPPSSTTQQQQAPLSAPRPFASQEHMRPQSPSARVRQDLHRPGTSPGPGQGRTPPPQQQAMPLSPPSLPSTRSESPGGSSLASSLGPGPGRPQAINVSPVREGRREAVNLQDPQQQATQQQQPPQQQTNGTGFGASAGANLFAATRQRWMTQQQQPQTQAQQNGPQRPLSPSAPQLAPIETSQPLQTSQQDLESTSANPKTGASEASSAGFDFGDAAAIVAITSFWGPEPTPAAAAAAATTSPVVVEEPRSPPTPERSARRPHLQDSGRGQSEAGSFDLRPPPLRAGGQRKPSADEGSAYATPRERSAVPSAAGSALHTPGFEESLDVASVRPLAVRDKRISGEQRPGSSASGQGKLAMPGVFTATPLGPSPLGTPATETPAEDDATKAAQAQREAQAADDAAAQAERERQEAEAYRPGLGPMIKKSVAREKFKKAAVATNAFKPRPGGAAEKILRAKAEREGSGAAVGVGNGEVDGVSGFVPRPGVVSPAPTPAVGGEKGGEGDAREVAPIVEVSSPLSPVPKSLDSPGILGLGIVSQEKLGVELHDESPNELLQTPDELAQRDAEEQAERELFEQREMRSKPQIKVKRRSQTQQRNLAALGIDPALLDGKALAFETTLTDFGWSSTPLDPKALANLEADLRREQSRLEAGEFSWPGSPHTDTQRDDKIAAVDSLLDKAIAECDDLEGLLTLYSVELGSLNEDVAFIEAQSQGLQVQSANQKVLVRELEGLVEVVSLDRRVLEPLRVGELGDVRGGGLGEVEKGVGALWGAMGTIDPSLRSGVRRGSRGRKGGSVGSGGSGEASEVLSGMKALREKREVFEREAAAFVQRLTQHLDYVFATSFGEARGRLMRPASGGAKRLNKEVFTEMRRGLWAYGPLVLFVRETNPPAWGTVLRMYYQRAGPVYGDVFRENLIGWKGAARKPGAEEAGLLFTAAEKEEGSTGGGGVSAARKLTIKRSQTLAKTLRTASRGKSPTEGSRAEGQMMSSEVFGGAMDEMAPLISQEQNFVVELFHANNLETQDFLEAVNAAPPEQRTGTNLLLPRLMDPDREMAKQVAGVMEQLFRGFARETGALLEWTVAGDPIQGVGVMACLSRHAYYLQQSSQEFLLQLLEGLSGHLQNLWSKFVDEQVRAIEETKVRSKKRKGVIGFMKVFPHFAAAVENVFSCVARDDYERPAESMYEVRRLVDETYGRLNRAMFDSLKVIAKESPTAGVTGQQRAGGAGAEDREDKEMLNYHILLIENMNHYVEEVDDGGREGVLAEWRGKAMLERAEALEAYVGRVITRPLGKLLDFLDSTESLLASHPANPTAIASRPAYSRKAARHLFSQYDAKEVRRGIDTLRKRMAKHFGDADEELISRNLVGFVGRECERAYERTLERMERLVREVYPVSEGEKGVEVEFSREDVRGAFKMLQR